MEEPLFRIVYIPDGTGSLSSSLSRLEAKTTIAKAAVLKVLNAAADSRSPFRGRFICLHQVTASSIAREAPSNCKAKHLDLSL